MKNRFFYNKYHEDNINVIELGYAASENKKDLLIKVSPDNGNNMFCLRLENMKLYIMILNMN